MILVRLDSYLRSGERAKPLRKAYQLFLKLLSRLYRGVYFARKKLYQHKLISKVQLDSPVISVGNLTWGGTGKTSLVIYLASRLEKMGKKVAVVTRGYGRKRKEALVLSCASNKEADWKDCGDEAILILQSLTRSAVVIHDKKYKAALLAQDHTHPDVVIIDDGFQHWKLKRDLDLVLAEASSPLGEGKLMPLGNLREPPGALGRANIVILTKAFNPIQDAIKSLSTFYKGPILETRYRITTPYRMNDHKEFDINYFAGKRALAFCGIGSPPSFYHLLEQTGMLLKKKASFPDHYPYGHLDLLSLEKESQRLKVDLLATTSKDATKIAANLQLEVPVFIFPIEVEFSSGEELLWQKVEEILRK